MSSPEPPSRVRAWMLAIRPKTLPAALAPVVVGTAIAASFGGHRAGPAAAAALGALAIQIATNLFNDVHDFEKGADTTDRLGPLRVTQSGLLPANSVRRGAWVACGVALACGAYLAAVAGWPVVVIGLCSLAAGFAYTAGPVPLAYNGLGDVFAFAFFGPVAVCGTVWVQMLRVPELAWWCSVPIGALTTAILVVNNVRDEPTDRRAGKRTLPVLLGRRWGVVEYALLLGLALATPAALVARGAASGHVLAVWLLIPEGVRWTAVLAGSRDGPRLNRALAGTARLLLLYALLLALGVLAPRWFDGAP